MLSCMLCVHILANSIGNGPVVQETLDFIVVEAQASFAQSDAKTLDSIAVEAQASFAQSGLSVTVVVRCHSFSSACQYAGQLLAFAY